MYTNLDGRLTCIDTALTNLTDSVISYNPSIPAAQALLSADDDLQTSLKRLHTHQRNHARIQQLRQTIDRQNQEITSTLQLLADTRADLLSIPTFLPAKARRNVGAEELLHSAQRIARFSVPPSFKHEAVAAPAIAGTGVMAQGAEGGEEAKEGVGMAALMEEEKRWLDPWTGVQFTPWPSEEIIRSSALACMHAGGTLGELYAEAKEEKPDENMQIEAPDDGDLRATGGGEAGVKREEKPKVFGGLDLYDPEMDD